eukprot:SAG31_NODE_17001_length_687_cov_0.860544_1_plen_65_part_00
MYMRAADARTNQPPGIWVHSFNFSEIFGNLGILAVQILQTSVPPTVATIQAQNRSSESSSIAPV